MELSCDMQLLQVDTHLFWLQHRHWQFSRGGRWRGGSIESDEKQNNIPL